MASPPYPKRDVLRFLLEDGQPVRILLDARREGVVVPPRFRVSPQLILEIGYRMNPPIPDLDIEGDGVRCTLSFAKQPFHCTLPWTSIWALTGKRDGRGYQWAEDIPPEIVAVPQPPPPPRMPPLLRAVPVAAVPKADDKPAEAPAEAQAEAPPPVAEGKPAEAEREERAVAEAADEDKSEARKADRAEAPAEAADASKPAEAPAEPGDKPAEGKEEGAGDEGEGPRPGGKKKRELPSYLRVIK